MAPNGPGQTHTVLFLPNSFEMPDDTDATEVTIKESGVSKNRDIRVQLNT